MVLTNMYTADICSGIYSPIASSSLKTAQVITFLNQRHQLHLYSDLKQEHIDSGKLLHYILHGMKKGDFLNS